MRYVKIRFHDEASESIPVENGYELPELDEFDARDMPAFFRIEAADGSTVLFPVNTIRYLHLTEAD